MKTRSREFGLRLSAPIRIGLFAGCIGFWILFFWPLLAHPRSRTHVPSCLSNIKQMGLALQMYAQDYDDRLPRAADWMDATYPYLKTRNTYRCPNLDSHNPADYGYAFNSLFSTRAITAIRNPEKAILLSDSNDLRWNAHAPGRTGLANPPRHSNYDAFGFADGHAKMIKLVPEEKPEPE